MQECIYGETGEMHGLYELVCFGTEFKIHHGNRCTSNRG